MKSCTLTSLRGCITPEIKKMGGSLAALPAGRPLSDGKGVPRAGGPAPGSVAW